MAPQQGNGSRTNTKRDQNGEVKGMRPQQQQQQQQDVWENRKQSNPCERQHGNQTIKGTTGLIHAQTHLTKPNKYLEIIRRTSSI